MTKISTSARNKSFWAKSKAEQRVAIAKDVLKQIAGKFYSPSAGDYFVVNKLKNSIEEPPEKLDVLFKKLKSVGASCEVCGIGGCFVSLVNLGDKAETRDFIISDEIEIFKSISDDDMRPLLRKVFSSEQLSMIESAFERGDFTDDHECYHTTQAIDFGKKYKSDRGRMIAIMNNIIKNKGTFIP